MERTRLLISCQNLVPYWLYPLARVTVYIATVIEYLATVVLELARNAAKDDRKFRIPCHLQLDI